MRSTASAVGLLFFAAPSLAALYEQASDLPTRSYDYIIVGGGTTGNVIANRLSEDPKISVLVLEAGMNNADEHLTEVPLMTTGLAPHTSVDWNYTTTVQPGLNNRAIAYPRGRILGGSSSINYMVFNCGSRDDWDYYARVTGNNKWSWDNMQPYFQKVERYVPPADGHDTTGQYIPSAHSTKGMVSVSLPGYPMVIGELAKNATKEFNGEFPFQIDQNAGDMVGIGYMQSNIGNGHRSSSATTYVGPQYINRPNLSILLHAQATKVIQTGTLKGLPRFGAVDFAKDSKSPVTRVTAKKEIVLSAGSFNTPQLLMLSGIGDQKLLTKSGIKTIVNNPSVGQNMSDHVLLPNVWTVNGEGTYNDYLSGPGFTDAMAEWESTSKGPMASSLGASVGWLRLPDTDPIFKKYPDPSTGKTSGHYELIFANGLLPLAGQTPATGEFLTIYANVITPYARGSVSLKSSNPFDAPTINPNLLGHPFDIHVLREAVKGARKFLSAKAWKEYIVAEVGDEFSNAKTDQQIEQYARNNAGTVWHATGTAQMSAKNAVYGVVDPDLKVKRVAGLRIADASVLPYVPSGHPTGSYYIMGERAAAFIKEDLANGVY